MLTLGAWAINSVLYNTINYLIGTSRVRIFNDNKRHKIESNF